MYKVTPVILHGVVSPDLHGVVSPESPMPQTLNSLEVAGGGAGRFAALLLVLGFARLSEKLAHVPHRIRPRLEREFFLLITYWSESSLLSK